MEEVVEVVDEIDPERPCLRFTGEEYIGRVDDLPVIREEDTGIGIREMPSSFRLPLSFARRFGL